MWRPEFTLNRQEALSGAVRTEASQRKMQIAVRRGSAIVWAVLRFFLIFGLSFIIVYPLLYMLSVSFREPSELFDPTVVWIPKSFTLENIRYVLEVIDYPKAVGKTLSIALSCSLVQTLTCAIAGYGFARFRFRGRGLLFTLALFTLIVPPQTITMPLYINYVDFTAWTAELSGGSGIPMLDTILPLFLPALFGTGIRAGLFIYLCRQYFRNMPLEMEDAAYIDGCGPIAAFWRIMLVNAGPILLVCFLFSFVWYWNDYLNVSLFYTNARPLSVLVSGLRDYLNTAYLPDGSAYSQAQVGVYVLVACLLFIAPVLILYLFLQKFFTQSIVQSGIVG
jgi:ABC-type sugar transport system, permease component